MAKPAILLDPFFRPMPLLFHPADLARLRRGATVLWARNAEPPRAFLDRHRDVDAIITGWWRYGPVAAFPRLRAVFEVGGGLFPPDHFDYATAFRRGVTVGSCAPGFGPAVAEMALALTLAITRGVVQTDRRFRAGNERWEFAETADSFSLFGRTVGFVGCGGLARNLRPMLAPFGVRVLAYDPWLPRAAFRALEARPADLDTLLRRSDVVYVLAMPTPHNRELLNRRRLALIRRGGVLILVSRSHLVDFKALTALVRRGRLRAAIDVFPREPLPRGHPLRRARAAVLSSHKAGAMDSAMKTIGRWTVDDVLAVLRGRRPRHMQIATPAMVGRLRP